MRTAAIISSSLLTIAISGAPVDLPKLSVGLPSLGLPSSLLPTGLSAAPVKPSHAFSATIPTGIPTGVPTISKEPTDAEFPVKNLPVRRAHLPVAVEALKDLKPDLPTLPKLPTGDLKLPVKRADFPALPVVDVPVNDIKVPTLPKLSTDAVKLPVRADLSIVNGAVKSIKHPTDAVKFPELPVQNVNLPIKRAHTPYVNAPVSAPVDDVLEVPSVNIPTVAVPNIDMSDVSVYQPTVGIPSVPEVDVLPIPKVARDIKQSLPVVGGANIPLDVGNIQVGTADNYVEEVVKSTKVNELPKVAREISQTLPVVGGADVPLDAGKIQVGTIDKYVGGVVKGTTLKNIPVEEVVKGTTVKDLPNVGPRDIKQSLPVVGSADVPLDVGEIQVGTVDKYVDGVVKGTTTGL